VDYHDSYCPELPEFGLSSVPLDDHRPLAVYDAVTIVTAHSDIDYRAVVHDADLVVDFRNATAGIPSAGNVWKL
jgi:UDP-N-acetyl-D-glucosamine dehydrogenase